jgi:hypothetical protein
MMHSLWIVLFIFALVSPVFSVQSVSKHSKKKNAVFLDALALNDTASILFEEFRSSHEKLYNHFGRVPRREMAMPANAVSMDFEVETYSMLQMTPELFLERGGIDLKSSQSSTAWPKVSDYFTMGIDGIGKKIESEQKQERGSYRQSFGGQIELETVLMRPTDVIKSAFTQQLQSVMDKLWAYHHNDSKAEYWSALPFAGAKGINIHVSAKGNPSSSCTACHVQWTAGVMLERVPELLAMTTSRSLKKVLSNVDAICTNNVSGCAPEYRAFVSLAAWTLKAVRSCGNCAHPKRCLQPWLVRTHFGDLALYLKDRIGTLDHLLDDVSKAAETHRQDKVFPHGLVDYVRFPEMAEMSGMVFPRAWMRSSQKKEHEIEDMPTSEAGMLQLASQMVKQRSRVNGILLNRGCGIHGADSDLSSSFTAEEWLRGIMDGKDLMSDHDSPISKSSFSHLVWKSMGNWRMKTGSHRVYLECRHTDLCLGIGKRPGPVALIREVGERMLEFERGPTLGRQGSTGNEKSSILRQSSRQSTKAEIKALGQVF